ncbi:MAG: decaprenyl-phosphate phosphoribosyltransferase [Bacillota bacterium]|nr:decaprenyl-phosphate phosphoribosyltransferase [Bacillota bacterium]MDP4159876.1 decaprenyl-phosphate phosphoribosyltransferase [Bacillota bacterium]
MRPKQWVKNSFVLVGMVFSHNWGQAALLLKTLLAAMAFCFVSSAVYVLNDFLDRERDRMHPEKCHRPLASGTVTPIAAGIIFMVSLSIGLLLGLRVSSIAFSILLFYVIQNIAYSAGLKQVVMLDVLLIAFGFMLRILMGTWGVGIVPSKWLLLSGFTLALFMGFGKRWAELNVLLTGACSHRPVLKNYSLARLNQLLVVSAGTVILTYSLYVIDPSTVILHHTPNLIYTVPFVIYGLVRYLYLIRVGKGGDPTKLVTKDSHIIAAISLWLVSVLLILS